MGSEGVGRRGEGEKSMIVLLVYYEEIEGGEVFVRLSSILMIYLGE